MKRATAIVFVLLTLVGAATPAFAASRASRAWQLRSLATREQNNSLRYLHTAWFKAMGYRYRVVPIASITEASGTAGVAGAVEVLDPPIGYSVSGSDQQQATVQSIRLAAKATSGPAIRTTRAQASAGYATALALANGTYDPTRVGVSRREAIRRTVAWTSGLALSHAQGEWGDSWQSPLWTYYLGAGSTEVWDCLPPITQELVTKAVTEEADRLLVVPPPVYRDATGTIISPGDSRAEENAWDAGLLFLAARCFASGDPTRASQWEAQARWYALTAFSTPNQVGSDPRIQGSNVNPDGTVTNHKIVHPDYMAAAGEMQVKCVLISQWSHSGEATECSNGLTVVWHALTKLKFPAVSPFHKPGGTIYRVGSRGVCTPSIYFPQGTDWSATRRHNLALMDVAVFVVGRNEGFGWAKVHINYVLRQQSRHKDRRVFSAGETLFTEDEQFAAVCAAEMVESLRRVR